MKVNFYLFFLLFLVNFRGSLSPEYFIKSNSIAPTNTLVFIFIGCKQNSSKESEILAIPLSVSIERFDKEFYLSNPEVIPKLKKNYSFLFPQKFTDSVWFNRQKDSLQLMLLDTVESIFPDMTPIENDLEYLLKHLKYYFPKIKST